MTQLIHVMRWIPYPLRACTSYGARHELRVPLQIEGIFSGTLSYIFNSLQVGTNFSDIVAQAKEAGFTEPDPRDDLAGMDVARKVTILARYKSWLYLLSSWWWAQGLPCYVVMYYSIRKQLPRLNLVAYLICWYHSVPWVPAICCQDYPERHEARAVSIASERWEWKRSVKFHITYWEDNLSTEHSCHRGCLWYKPVCLFTADILLPVRAVSSRDGWEAISSSFAYRFLDCIRIKRGLSVCDFT